MCFNSTQERSPKYEWCFFINVHIEYHKVDKDKQSRILTGMSSAILARYRIDESVGYNFKVVGDNFI